jgi:hypothetical protein
VIIKIQRCRKWLAVVFKKDIRVSDIGWDDGISTMAASASSITDLVTVEWLLVYSAPAPIPGVSIIDSPSFSLVSGSEISILLT